jgi:nitrate/TMAO reductase-like tetraheme cytochrome c subunit
MKHCGGCDKNKLPSEFHRNKNNSDGLTVWCKECAKAKSEAWYHSHKDYMREYRKRTSDHRKEVRKRWRLGNPSEYKLKNQKYHLKRDFGLSLDEHEQMRKNQNYQCAICGIPESEFDRKLSVDHNHVTGKLRGLLCVNCNKGMGHFHDDIELLKKAISYLEVHSFVCK